MRSPADPSVELIKDQPEPALLCYRCPTTHGIWIRADDYRDWHKRAVASPDAPPPFDADAEPIELGADSPAGKRCPEDGYFLIRYAVGHGLGFHVERCGHCGGVWLDAGEWETLRREGLGKTLHLVFTSAWQAKVRRDKQAAAAEQRLRGWFGDADFAEARRVRRWIDEHPKSYELRAYLDGEYGV